MVNFNSTAQTKGFLATPKSPGLGNQNVPTFGFWCENNSNFGDIPEPESLFQTILTVPGVIVNGISQTYSVYLFSQGSQTTAAFKFTI